MGYSDFSDYDVKHSSKDLIIRYAVAVFVANGIL